MKRIKKTGFSVGKFSLCLALLGLTIFSCKKGPEYYKTNVPSQSSTAEFAPVTAGTTVGNYFVKSTNDPYSLIIGFTGYSDGDRTVNFTATSKTAVAGVQYIAPGSLTVKAGRTFDTLKFKALFAGYPSGRRDTVTIKMSGYPTVNNVDSFRIVIQPYCDVLPTTMVGNFTTSRDYYPSIAPANASASAYTATVSDFTPLTATTATIKIKNLGNTTDVGFAPFAPTDGATTGILATMDWTDPANFKITILSQPYVASLYTYGASTISGTGTFSSCDQSITLSYSVKVSIGSFINQWSKLTR